MLADKDFLDIESLLDPSNKLLILPATYKPLPNNVLASHVASFLDAILAGSQHNDMLKSDKRIIATLDYIDGNLKKRIEVKDLVKFTGLSAERTRHLFVEKVGINFSQYVLWLRIRKTLACVILEKVSMKEATSRCGFTDQSHFNRSFIRIFGQSPRNLLEKGRVLI